MDISTWTRKGPDWLKKYRYPILILMIGLLLMLWPGKKEVSQQKETAAVKTQTPSLSQQLAGVLSRMQGVGKVEVLLTVRVGETTLYQTDEDITHTENGSTIRKETVIVTGSDRSQQPLIMQILSPEYLGAVIVCQGADSVQVRQAVVEAVSKATGLGADKITVVKMK